MQSIRRRIRSGLRRLLPVLVTLGLLTSVTVVTGIVTSTSATADVSAPTWWGGKTCDTNNYPGSYALGASYNGVQACGPGSYSQGGTDHLEHFYSGAWGEYEWECVELVMRYMYLVYGIAPYNAPGGKDVVGNYSGTVLTSVNNDGKSLPTAGDILSFAGTTSNPYGHTAVVTAVSSSSVTIMEQNATSDGWGSLAVSGGKITGTVGGGSVTGWLHNPNGGGGSGDGTHSTTILKVKKVIASDGTQQVYYATSSDVYEAWWNSTSNGVRRDGLLNISQNNIVDMDKITQPDGTQSLYTAVPDGIWETYWNSTSNGPQSNKIISGLSGVTKVIATSETDNGTYTHVLYVLTSSGPYQFWWQDGGNGIHSTQLTQINNPVAFSFDQTSGGTDQLYTASAGGVWETWWNPGGAITTDLIISVSQNNITGVSKVIASNGTNELYTSTTVGVWQSEWGGSVGGLTNTYFVNNFSGSVGVKKMFDPGGSDNLYVANGGAIQQYWWNSSGSGGATLITISQGNIASFDVDFNNGTGQLYTAAGAWVYETYWDGSGIHTNSLANANP